MAEEKVGQGSEKSMYRINSKCSVVNGRQEWKTMGGVYTQVCLDNDIE